MKKLIIVILTVQLAQLNVFAATKNSPTKVARMPSQNEEIQSLLNDFVDLKSAYRFVTVATKDQAFEKEWLRFFAQKGFNSEVQWTKSYISQDGIFIEGLTEPIQLGFKKNVFVYKSKPFEFQPLKSPEFNYAELVKAWGEFPELKSGSQSGSQFFIEIDWLPKAKADVGPLYTGILAALGVYATLAVIGVTAVGVGAWYAYKKLYREPKEIEDLLKANQQFPVKAVCADGAKGIERGNLKFLFEEIDKKKKIYSVYAQHSFKKFLEMSFKKNLNDKAEIQSVEVLKGAHEFWITKNGQLTEIFNLVLKVDEVCAKSKSSDFNAVSIELFDFKKSGKLQLISDSPQWKPSGDEPDQRLPASQK